MKYKLLVIDVDGTLLNNKNEISKRTLYTLRNVQQAGVRILIASGRPTFGLIPLAKKLELDNYGGYILSYNGCQIIDVKTGTIVFEKQINRQLLPYLEKKSHENKCDLFTYKDNCIITDSPNNKYICSEARINNMQIVYKENFAEAIDFAPYKCVLVNDDENILVPIEERWHKRLNGSVDVFRSEPYFLEIVPPLINKANSLGVLLKELDIKKEEVIAIGDSVCDVTMIQIAGLGVAMGNAKEQVKRCADVVTESNDNDGVALIAENVILNEIHFADIRVDELNDKMKHTLMSNLGITYTFISETRVEATMPVDYRTRQPFGILHGGATLALAETVAGLGSMIICKPDEIAVGMQVSGNHISSAHEGDTVRAVGTIVHKGRSSHVWNVDVFTSTDKLVSSIRVVNSIMKKQ